MAALGRTADAALPRPPPAADRLPRGTVYRSRADGSYVRSRKFPLADFAQPIQVGGESVFVVRGPALVRADAQGTPRYQVPLDPTSRFNAVEAARDGSRLYVLNDKRLAVLDAASGAERFHIDLPPQSWMPRATPLDDGRVILTAGKKMLTLDADLHELATKDLKFEPTYVTPLAGGGLVLHESMRGRQMQVMAPNGDVILDLESDRVSYRPTVTQDGKVWWLEYNDSSSSCHRVGSFDPQTRAARSFDTTKNAKYIHPRQDGSCLVHEEDMVVAPRFVLYDRDGHEVRRFKPAEQGALEQLMLSPDERSAYVLYDRYLGFDSKAERRSAIDRLDLDERGGVLQENLGFVTRPLGMASSGQRIYEGECDPKRFFPMVLEDGSLLIFHAKEVERLDDDGKVLQTFADASAVNSWRPRARQDLMHGSAADSVNQHLANWQHDYLYVDLNEHRVCGSALPTADGCVSIQQPLPKEQAVREMALDEEEMERAAQRDMVTRIFAAGGKQDGETVLPFAGNSGARIRLGRETLDLEVPHVGGGQGEYDRVGFSFDGEREFTGALALRAGEKYIAVASTSDGRVYWLDGSSNSLDRECPRYDVGTPVKRLAVHGKVYGFGDDGSVLVIEPPSGVTLDQTRSRLVDEEPHKDTRVIVTDRQVKIGGVTVPRRYNPLFPDINGLYEPLL